MPLIIEGPDHVGKTTAAKTAVEIAISMGIPSYYAHMSAPPPDFDYYHHYLYRAQPYAIQDRFHFGGLVYGDICRGGNKIGPHKLRLLEARLALMGTVTVVLVANADWLESRLASDKKSEMYKRDQILATNAQFQALAYAKRYSEASIDFVRSAHGGHDFADYDEIRSWVILWKQRLHAAKALEGLK